MVARHSPTGYSFMLRLCLIDPLFHIIVIDCLYSNLKKLNLNANLTSEFDQCIWLFIVFVVLSLAKTLTSFKPRSSDFFQNEQ